MHVHRKTQSGYIVCIYVNEEVCSVNAEDETEHVNVE